MEIKFNKIEINNEEDLEKFIKELLNVTAENEKNAKSKLLTEIGDVVIKMEEMAEKTIDEDETVEELEMLLEAHKSVLEAYEKILENRKSN